MKQEDTCRLQFEEWARRVNPVSVEGALKRKDSGEYLWSGTALAWQAWREGWNAQKAEMILSGEG